MLTQPRNILIVDDEEMIRKIMARTLRKEGYRVEVAGGPDEGLAILAQRKMDLVISDHLMPEMTGLEFLQIVRDRYPDCLRLMLTGHADVEVAVQAINQGAIYRLLTKPWDDLELKTTLFTAFEQLDLERENRRLAAMVRCQQELLRSFEIQHPSVNKVDRDCSGAILIED